MDIYFWLREMAIEAQYKEGMGSEKRRRLLEAADEIERLREVVRLLIEYEEHDEAIHCGATLWETLIDKARAALRGDE
jgi:hypothetical protein